MNGEGDDPKYDASLAVDEAPGDQESADRYPPDEDTLENRGQCVLPANGDKDGDLATEEARRKRSGNARP